MVMNRQARTVPGHSRFLMTRTRRGRVTAVRTRCRGRAAAGRRPLLGRIGPTLTLLVVLGLVAGACTGLDPERAATPDSRGSTEPWTLPEGLVLAGALAPFDACDDFLAHVKEHALEMVTPYGLGGGGGWPMFGMDDDVAAEDDPDSGPAPGDAPLTEGEDFSGTNVQEVGVDEPDILKTDGRTMYLISRGTLEIIDITEDDPVSLASVPLAGSWGARLMLHGDRLLMTTSGGPVIPFADEAAPGAGSDGAMADEADDMAMPYDGGTTLTAIDVSDPSDPVVQERLVLDGYVVNSRMVDGVVRVVVRTEPGINLPWSYPRTGSLRGERDALAENRQVIKDSAAEDWLPYYVHTTADGRVDEGVLVGCNRVAHPEAFSGLGILSVLTVDLAGGSLTPGPAATGILAAGDTVYASTERLYVATTRWADWDRLSSRQLDNLFRDATTELHAFDISDPRAADYLGSGEVPGTLLSQWAMSEHDGHLRVASTVGDPWGGGRRGPSESLVTVLEVRDGELAQVGQVDGLGVTETIYAVRFMGDIGYVVTFRQTDPLYTLDLRDPTDPQVTGELKIMGYSAYLHPMGNDLLLGVGQDADATGRTKGMQLSLFDVSDPAAPAVLDQFDLTNSYSEVEHDHHAFLHWPATGLTAVPFERWYDWTREDPRELGPMSGVLAFTVTRADGIIDKGVLSHMGPYLRDLDLDLQIPEDEDDRYRFEDEMWQYQYETRIVRSLVVGDRLVTVSDVGIATNDLDTLDERGWLTFENTGRW
jgi:uncharacterized secreted protein with C-terminal beta-propeller domain